MPPNTEGEGPTQKELTEKTDMKIELDKLPPMAGGATFLPGDQNPMTEEEAQKKLRKLGLAGPNEKVGGSDRLRAEVGKRDREIDDLKRTVEALKGNIRDSSLENQKLTLQVEDLTRRLGESDARRVEDLRGMQAQVESIRQNAERQVEDSRRQVEEGRRRDRAEMDEERRRFREEINDLRKRLDEQSTQKAKEKVDNSEPLNSRIWKQLKKVQNLSDPVDSNKLAALLDIVSTDEKASYDDKEKLNNIIEAIVAYHNAFKAFGSIEKEVENHDWAKARGAEKLYKILKGQIDTFKYRDVIMSIPGVQEVTRFMRDEDFFALDSDDKKDVEREAMEMLVARNHSLEDAQSLLELAKRDLIIHQEAGKQAPRPPSETHERWMNVGAEFLKALGELPKIIR